MIFAAPNTQFESVAQSRFSGLVGTIGVRILDDEGGVAVARTTAGIIEYPPNTGHYSVTLTAPLAAGDYSVFWDEGTDSPDTTTSEPLRVTYSGGMGPLPSGGALTTVEAVVHSMGQTIDQTDYDQDTIQDFINAASLAIHNYTGREFAPATASATRTYVYDGSGLLDLAPYDLRSVSAIQVDTQTDSPRTLAATEYALRPKPSKHGVYYQIRLPRSAESEVAITGAWGFPTIPTDVEQAARQAVVSWLRTQVSVFSRMVDEDGIASGGTWLPSGSRQLLNHYRVRTAR